MWTHTFNALSVTQPVIKAQTEATSIGTFNYVEIRLLALMSFVTPFSTAGLPDPFTDSTTPLRRSTRRTQTIRPARSSCEGCVLLQPLYFPNGNTRSPVCPECNHFQMERYRKHVETCNRQLICSACTRPHVIPPAHRLCACPCECLNNDNHQEDTDYLYSFEAEDDISNQLTGPAVSAEEQLARKYGWRTNVIADEGEDHERRIFYEPPGHQAMGSMHDIGKPDESLYPSSENTVGRTEVNQLHAVLEPWELEAVHLSTGRSYDFLSRIFLKLVQ